MKKNLIFLVFCFGIINISYAQSYIGYVTKPVNLRTAANTNSTIISSLQKDSPLFVVSSNKTNGYYQVVDIETNKEGYVHSNFVWLDQMLPENKEGIFTPTGKTNTVNPVLRIHNNTSRTLTLKLNDSLYTFSPQEKRTITVPTGTYSYRASAPGVIPDYGRETIQGNYEYEWSFYISKSGY